MRLFQAREKTSDAQVKSARLQIDLAVDKMTRILDEVQEEITVVKKELKKL